MIELSISYYPCAWDGATYAGFARSAEVVAFDFWSGIKGFSKVALSTVAAWARARNNMRARRHSISPAHACPESTQVHIVT